MGLLLFFGHLKEVDVAPATNIINGHGSYRRTKQLTSTSRPPAKTTATMPPPTAAMHREKRSKRKHVAFSVSAGAYPYQMGLAHYLRTHFDIDAMDVFFSGASGGAWAAVLLASGLDIEEEALATLKALGPNCCKGRWLGAYGVYDQGMRSVFYALFDGVDLAAKVGREITPWSLLVLVGKTLD
jgi:hypothetical protein